MQTCLLGTHASGAIVCIGNKRATGVVVAVYVNQICTCALVMMESGVCEEVHLATLELTPGCNIPDWAYKFKKSVGMHNPSR